MAKAANPNDQATIDAAFAAQEAALDGFVGAGALATRAKLTSSMPTATHTDQYTDWVLSQVAPGLAAWNRANPIPR